MRHASTPKERINLLVRYTKLLLSIIFSNRNIVYLYITAMIFSAIMLVFYFLLSMVRDRFGISLSDWRMVAFFVAGCISVAIFVSPFDDSRLS